jgi:hypothetical protein
MKWMGRRWVGGLHYVERSSRAGGGGLGLGRLFHYFFYFSLFFSVVFILRSIESLGALFLLWTVHARVFIFCQISEYGSARSSLITHRALNN